jgi:hypothetical protein
MMEVIRFSEDLASIYQTTWRHVSGENTDNFLLILWQTMHDWLLIQGETGPG